MSYNYRCSKSKCRARVTFRKRIEEYVRDKLCPGCKKDTLKCHTKTEKARNKRRSCHCDGYTFPHTHGSEPWCRYAIKGPTDKDFEDRYR